MTRYVIYARYSSDRQSEKSIEDQVRLCSEYVRDGSIVEIYSDYAISGGHIMNRPAFLKLMSDAKAGLFDVLIIEALDRLSRDQEDIAGIYKRLTYQGVKIRSLAEGEIDEMDIGFKGTMNAIHLKDIAAKTRRGQRGRVEDGAIPGGLTFGYKIVNKFDAKGQPIRGLREIHPEESVVVQRIFKDYISGLSGRTIAMNLNKEGVPAPRGGVWNASTINGNKARKNGILNNELYAGKIIYNRQTFSKNPETGKRTPRVNPQKDWITKHVPHLQIIDDETWNSAHNVKRVFSSVPKNKARRPKHVLSGLLVCKECNGNLTIIGRERVGCVNAKERGTCANKSSFSLKLLQDKVLGGLRKHMHEPEKIKLFSAMYHEECHRIHKEKTIHLGVMTKRLKQIDKEIEGSIQAILDGFYNSALKAKVIGLEAEKISLQAMLQEKDIIIDVHPNLAPLYAKKIDDLYTALMIDSPEVDQTAAFKILRNLIDRVAVSKGENKKGIALEIQGNLAKIMYFMAKNDKNAHDQESQLIVVAGTGLSYNFPSMQMKPYIFISG